MVLLDLNRQNDKKGGSRQFPKKWRGPREKNAARIAGRRWRVESDEHFAIRYSTGKHTGDWVLNGEKTDPGMAAAALLLKLPRQKDLKKGTGQVE